MIKERITLYAKLLRIYQWTKNGFVFLPFVFTEEALHIIQHPLTEESRSLLLKLLFAFFSFSFMASSVYILNDWKDRELDRLDSKKRLRPLASGKVSTGEAFFLFLLVFGSSYFLSGFIGNVYCFYTLSFYFVLNLFYSFGAKRFILVDVFFIATGFVIRVLFGSYAVDAYASPWLVSTTFFLALFLGFYKRYFEVLHSPAEVLIGGIYRRETLKSFIDISAAMTIITYSLYTILGTHAKANLYWTIPFVVMGIFRYYTLIENPENKEGNPSDVLLADPFLIVLIFMWLVTSVVLILISSSP